MATSIPKFDEKQHPRHESDHFKIKRDILLALGIKDDDSSSSSEDHDDNDHTRSTDSDENETAIVNIGGQRRYGRPPGRGHRHGYSFGQNHRRRHGRDRGYTQENDQKEYEQGYLIAVAWHVDSVLVLNERIRTESRQTW